MASNRFPRITSTARGPRRVAALALASAGLLSVGMVATAGAAGASTKAPAIAHARSYDQGSKDVTKDASNSKDATKDTASGSAKDSTAEKAKDSASSTNEPTSGSPDSTSPDPTGSTSPDPTPAPADH